MTDEEIIALLRKVHYTDDFIQEVIENKHKEYFSIITVIELIKVNNWRWKNEDNN